MFGSRDFQSIRERKAASMVSADGKKRKASDLSYEERSLIPHPILQPSYLLYLNSDQRIGGSVNNAFFNIVQPFPRNIFACSVKEMIFVNTIPSLDASTWAVIYTANPSGFPTQFTLTGGIYTYGYGTVTYAQASPTIPDLWTNDIRYVLLNSFGGAVTSINVNSITNRWTFNWASSTVSVAWNPAFTSSFLYNVFQLPASLSAPIWTSLGPVNLSPPAEIAVASYELDNEQLRSSAGPNSWTCLVQVDSGPGELVFHTPQREDIAVFGKPLTNLSTLNVQLQIPYNSATGVSNGLVQGLTWWSLVFRLYQDEYST